MTPWPHPFFFVFHNLIWECICIVFDCEDDDDDDEEMKKKWRCWLRLVTVRRFNTHGVRLIYLCCSISSLDFIVCGCDVWWIVVFVISERFALFDFQLIRFFIFLINTSKIYREICVNCFFRFEIFELKRDREFFNINLI